MKGWSVSGEIVVSIPRRVGQLVEGQQAERGLVATPIRVGQLEHRGVVTVLKGGGPGFAQKVGQLVVRVLVAVLRGVGQLVDRVLVAVPRGVGQLVDRVLVAVPRGVGQLVDRVLVAVPIGVGQLVDRVLVAVPRKWAS